MTHVIASPCIDVKDGACVDVCPVDCIYTGGRMLYIQPDECIDCGVCLSVCPVAAIFEDHALPPAEAQFATINRLRKKSVGGASSPIRRLLPLRNPLI